MFNLPDAKVGNMTPPNPEIVRKDLVNPKYQQYSKETKVIQYNPVPESGTSDNTPKIPFRAYQPLKP